MPTQYRGVYRVGATLGTSFSTAAGAAVTGLSNSVNMARLVATAACFISYGSTSGSSSGGAYLPANVPIEITVDSSGTQIGVVSSVTVTTGFLYVTELS